jgi:hypothetical protein
MQKPAPLERRISSPKSCELDVEIGVNYCRTIGVTRALAFLAENGVPIDVALRVTSPGAERRVTLWERHVNEAALRKALGARPLLGKC